MVEFGMFLILNTAWYGNWVVGVIFVVMLLFFVLMFYVGNSYILVVKNKIEIEFVVGVWFWGVGFRNEYLPLQFVITLG